MPSTSARPLVARMMFIRILMAVVLPAPLGPTKAYGAFRDVQRESLKSIDLAEALDESVGLDGAGHFFPRPPRSDSELVLSRFQ